MAAIFRSNLLIMVYAFVLKGEDRTLLRYAPVLGQTILSHKLCQRHINNHKKYD